MSDLHARINALSPAKRALLERRLTEQAAREYSERIEPRDSTGNAPLSFGQQRFWFLEQWEPGNAAYNTSIVLQIEGLLDAGTLDRALTELARRHETLRTTFALEGERPVQVVHAAGGIRAARLDLMGRTDEERETEADGIIREQATAPFDLVRGPLWRAGLIHRAPRTHLLLLTMHHSVFDGWSSAVLQRELLALYEAFAAGRGSPLAALPIQYADYAVWQRRTLEGQLSARQLRYWREQLREVATIELPTDYPRPPIQTFNGARQHLHLGPTLVESLKRLGREEGATLFMVLLAAFQALLHRYTGQTDLAVGTPIAGRTRVELEELIGFFVNMLVLRADASGDPTFRELLARVKQVAFEAYAHQDVPFEKLVEELRPHRDPGRNPLFQVVFALQNPPRSPAIGPLKVTRLRPPQASTRFDLEVHVQETDEGVTGLFVYNTSLFAPATIERMTDHFRTLVTAIAADPDLPLSRLPLLTRDDRHQALVAWNATGTPYPRDACVHTIFEALARTAPDATAAEFGTERVTYRHLNERANRLAHHLRTLGVSPEVLVGVCVEPSIDMLVGLLGTLKAGGAYVPLDPTYPRERLALMLHDAHVAVLLTEERLRPRLPAIEAPVLCLDGVRLGDMDVEDPRNPATAGDLAYVIYTSGSTGQPKGVAVPHRAVVRLVIDTNYVELGHADRIAQVSNPSFDAATFEIWGALLNGATLVGIPHDVLLSPRAFAGTLQQQKISALFLTTALFNQVAASVPEAFRSLRYLLFGGETCDPKSVRTVLEHGAPQHLLHVYGPTENTTFSTFNDVDAVAPDSATVPIGRPVANSRAHILDRHLQPVPPGVVGELYLGGDGLARGYLNRPDLTADAFIGDPFDDDPAARLYRTGDFARYRSDGQIEFVGRRDRQVKLRGFRIELQEIEAALSAHPDVAASVVVTRARPDSGTTLVAYVTPAGGSRPTGDALRRFLRRALPDYMVPSAFVVLDSFPLTPNGKVDHAALPEPPRDRPEPEVHFAAPMTSVQKTLARIWEELLGVRPVGIHHNFFDLGGHSLLAIQLITRIEKECGKTLPVAVLFQSPTIAQLVDILDDDTRPPCWSSLIPLRPDGSDVPFFWVHGDSSNAVLPAYLGPTRPLYGLEHQAHDGQPARYTTVETIAAHYLDELRTVRPHGPYFLGGYSFGAVTAYEMAQQLRRAGEDVALLFMLDPPGKTNTRRMSFADRWRRRTRELAARTTGAKLAYLGSRAVPVVRHLAGIAARGLSRRVQELRWNARIRAGRQLPPALRSPYILGLYRQALRSYVPAPYSGRVIIFTGRNASYQPPMDWFALISGELDALEGSGDHFDMVKEPSVSAWARRLADALGT